MVAFQATFLCAEQALIKGEQSLVDFKDVVVSMLHEILHDNVKLVGMGEREPAFMSISFISASGSSRAIANAMAVGLEGL